MLTKRANVPKIRAGWGARRRRTSPSIGAGPCGLACGARARSGSATTDWAIYERAAVAGGHAGSEVDPAGFTWDQGGHVVFSHFGEFDRAARRGARRRRPRARALVVRARRTAAGCRTRSRTTCATSSAEDALRVPRRADRRARRQRRTTDFATWMEATFGEGITRHFMRPVQPQGLGDAARADVGHVDRRARQRRRRQARARGTSCSGSTTSGWGPNNTFKFPRSGGTGEIYRRARRPARRRRSATSAELVGGRRRAARAALRRRTAARSTTRSSRRCRSTVLVGRDRRCPVRRARGGARRSSTTASGSSASATSAPLADDSSWLYFAERSTCPSTGSRTSPSTRPRTSPAATRRATRSYLTETAYSRRPPGRAGAARATGWSTALVATGLIDRRTCRSCPDAPDRRRLRVSDPDARARRGARGRPALAAWSARSTRAAASARGATRSATWTTPRRWASTWRGSSSRAAPKSCGPPEPRRLSRARRDPLLAARRRASASRRCRSRSCSSAGCRAAGSSSRCRSGCSRRRSRSGCSRASTPCRTGAAPRWRRSSCSSWRRRSSAARPRARRARRRGDLALARRRDSSSPSRSSAGRCSAASSPRSGRRRSRWTWLSSTSSTRASGSRRTIPGSPATDLNYYYFGHYLVAFLVRITGIDPAVGFNLAVALFYALVDGSRLRRRRGALRGRAPERRRAAAVAVLVGLDRCRRSPPSIGNIAGGFQLLARHRPAGTATTGGRRRG